MKKYLYWNIAILLITAQKAFCITDSLSSDLEQSLKINQVEPNFVTIIFALLFVVFLIYITGIIYSKLNLVGAKAVKEQLKNYDLSKAIVLSTTQLGQGKNLHVIELNKSRYLIGATTDSITLIKELGSLKEEPEEAVIAKTEAGIEESLAEVEPEVIVEPEIEEVPEADIDKAIRMLYNKNQEEEIIEEPEEDEFDVHKKYL